jgi:hypothetical protein
MKPRFELADIIRCFSPAFEEQYHPPAFQQKTLEAISLCRTAALGGHKQMCTHCGHEHISYNSCRNRHCPECQNRERELWVRKIREMLPPCRYFHVIFTLPSFLNGLFIAFQREMQDVLFQAAGQTLEQFAAIPAYPGAQTGMIALLHTWGQTLTLHPHLHCIVPDGGIDGSGQWVRAKKTDGRSPFLFPVISMAGVFRGKFLCLMSKMLKNKPGCRIPSVRGKHFNINIQPPFREIDHLIGYPGRYTHKTAIGNHRIRNIDSRGVVFSYKDYRDRACIKEMFLTDEEFLRRFCLHIQQKGFRKIRYFGIFAASSRRRLNSVRLASGPATVQPRKKKNRKEDVRETGMYDPCLCPECGVGVMVTVGRIFPPGRPPPWMTPTYTP